MNAGLESNKTKIARRLVEVLEFFAAGNRRATVMDIVRCYGRPQSSTSELLGSLVEMGLLYKDPQTRTYAPTPRLAALGTAAQPDPIASGRLFAFMDQLAQSSRCGVGLFGLVGTRVQIFRWSHGGSMASGGLECGASASLASGAAGLVLLASLGAGPASRMLWRLQAEADGCDRFDLAETKRTVARIAECGHASGPSGFAPDTIATVVLLPEGIGAGQLALGAVHDAATPVDCDALVATIRHGAAQCLDGSIDTPPVLVRSMVAM